MQDILRSFVLLGIVVALLIIVADQFSKALIFGYLSSTSPVVQITSFFNLVTAWNKGVSFSMFDNLGANGVYMLSGFSMVVVSVLFYWLWLEEDKKMQTALGFIIGGALGNVIDRIRVGAVFDFLDIHINTHHWPAFNVADSFICIGAFLIVLNGLCSKNCTTKSKVKIQDKEN